MDPLDLKVWREHRAPREMMETLAFLAKMDKMDLMDCLVPMACQGLQA